MYLFISTQMYQLTVFEHGMWIGPQIENILSIHDGTILFWWAMALQIVTSTLRYLWGQSSYHNYTIFLFMAAAGCTKDPVSRGIVLLLHSDRMWELLHFNVHFFPFIVSTWLEIKLISTSLHQVHLLKKSIFQCKVSITAAMPNWNHPPCMFFKQWYDSFLK